MNVLRFPENFSLGAASAATQIDGDCKESNWYDWYQKGRIQDGSDPDIATRHRARMQEDTQLMADMGIRHYRFGLEWARIEPQDGVFSNEEFAKVREEVLLLKQHGIHVLLTIHHFSNPMWFERSGGFLRRDCADVFERLTRKVVEKLGDLVREYITLNEPNVYAVNGYMGGGFPPGKNNVFKALKVMKNMGECHRRAYLAIHELREAKGWRDSRVSFAHHMRAFAPANPRNPWHRFCARMSEQLFQGKINDTYLIATDKNGRRMRYVDFLAVNYYTRTASKGFADGTFKSAPVNDLGWEIYPQGIVECCAKLHKILPELPIYITENGTADGADAFRRRYLYDHLKALCESDLPVTRYYHWCFVDNFEWLEGFTARFGLVHLDTKTMQRTVKKSGAFYTQMIQNKGVTQEMADALMQEVYPHA